MRILVLYHYPPDPGGLATQGDLLYKGLVASGIEAHPVHSESNLEKEWYYRWFKPDAVVGIGFWGHTPHLVLHPREHGMRAVPWLVADGYIAAHHQVLNDLPLIFVTSQWVKETYIRDGIRGDDIEVLPVGCDVDSFCPRDRDDPKVRLIREALGVADDEIMVLTAGGDAASKGAQEVMQALAMIDKEAPPWKYVCKTWPQPRTFDQDAQDRQLAERLGIQDKVIYACHIASRNFMPYLLAACDIYAAPSRLEGFGMIQVEAGACGKPVIGINAMGLLDTMTHGQNALLAGVNMEVRLAEVSSEGRRVKFDSPRAVDFRASVHDLAEHLLTLMRDPQLRRQMGEAGRRRAVEQFDYRKVARQMTTVLERKLGIH